MYTDFVFIPEFIDITEVSGDYTVSEKTSFPGCALGKMARRRTPAWAGRRRDRDK